MANEMAVEKAKQMYEVWFAFNEEDVSKASLAREYGVSERTIGRWIDKVDDIDVDSFGGIGSVDDLLKYFGLEDMTPKFTPQTKYSSEITADDLVVQPMTNPSGLTFNIRFEFLPESIAPKLWNAYKDVLSKEHLEELKQVILDVENHEDMIFEDEDDIDCAFSWDSTKQGEEFWESISVKLEDGTYEKNPTQWVQLQAIILPHTIVLVRDGQPQQIDSGHKFFTKVKELIETYNRNGSIEQNKLDEIYNLIDLKNGIEEYTNGRVKVTQEGVTFDDKVIHNSLSQKMIDLLVNSDINSLNRFAKFMEKVDQCVSYRVNHNLYDFVKASSLEIDEDGDILAFKAVRSTYFDKHSNTMDNSPGLLVEMDRKDVDDNPANECSVGLHACSISYLSSFYSYGDRVVLVKINPADFITAPADYSFAKARVCKYLVLEDITDREDVRTAVRRY